MTYVYIGIVCANKVFNIQSNCLLRQSSITFRMICCDVVIELFKKSPFIKSEMSYSFTCRLLSHNEVLGIIGEGIVQGCRYWTIAYFSLTHSAADF